MSDYEPRISLQDKHKMATETQEIKNLIAAAEIEEATKFDRQENKSPISMIPSSAIHTEADVLAFGAAKYGRDNWKKGMEWTRLVDAALRHIWSWKEKEDLDPESGLSHLAHAKCCLSFLIEYQEKGAGTDDR